MSSSLHSTQYRRLTNWLKASREASGLSMRDLAAKLDKPHSYIGKVEQQERRLDVVEYVQYCEAIGVLPQEGLKIISG